MLDLARCSALSLLWVDPVTSLALLAVAVLSSRLIFLHALAWFLLPTVCGKLGEQFGYTLLRTSLVLGFFHGFVLLVRVLTEMNIWCRYFCNHLVE